MGVFTPGESSAVADVMHRLHSPAMRNLLLVAALVPALLTVTPAVALNPPPEMSPEGAGPVRIGMSTAEALAIRPAPIAQGYGDPSECEVYALHKDQAFWFMIERGKVVRTTAGIGGVTVEGVNVGDPEAKVRAAYSVLDDQPAKYAEPPAHDVTWWKTADSGIRFEINADGRVATIHAGGKAIEYVENCL